MIRSNRTQSISSTVLLVNLESLLAIFCHPNLVAEPFQSFRSESADQRLIVHYQYRSPPRL